MYEFGKLLVVTQPALVAMEQRIM